MDIQAAMTAEPNSIVDIAAYVKDVAMAQEITIRNSKAQNSPSQEDNNRSTTQSRNRRVIILFDDSKKLAELVYNYHNISLIIPVDPLGTSSRAKDSE